MILDKENINFMVNHRLEKARDTITEVKSIITMNSWCFVADRLYYACYYAVTALLIKNGHLAYKHNEVFAILRKYFVQEGILSKEYYKLYQALFEIKQKDDCCEVIVLKEEDIIPLIQPAENFIAEIEKLINDN